MLRPSQHENDREDGAVLLTVALTLTALLAIAGLVLDLGAVRANRAASRVAADAAATAGALDIPDGGGRAACETALSYLELNLPGVATLSGASCHSFPLTCDDSTAPLTATGSSGQWTATVTYPVPDDSPMIEPSAIGAVPQAVDADDGSQCDRIAVSVTSTHDHIFAGVIGADPLATEVSAVAVADEAAGGEFALNLLVLERYDCNAISASGGGGGDSGILVDSVYNPNTGELDPGFIAVDSDGSSGCSGGVLDVDGSNASIRADGPAGCAGEVGTHIGPGGLTVGEGCGEISLLAPGTPGCNHPACTSSGLVAPDPSALDERITRAPVDHLFNCKSSYPFPSGWEIEPCPDPAAPHLDNLTSRYGGTGTPAGFNTWTGAGYSCTVSGGPGTVIIVPAGNWRVDCSKLTVNAPVIFQGGDVIFDGDIDLAADGVLAVNTNNSGSFPYSAASTAAVAYMRDGELKKAGGASLLLHNTLAYLSPTSNTSMQGGTGTVVWTAPTSGSFEDLAMWSDGSTVHGFAGQAALDLEGVFFAPWARISYTGNGAQSQVKAQFIARALSTSGQGTLIVRPGFDRAVLIPATPQSRLIR